jgi:hypothetical protein
MSTNNISYENFSHGHYFIEDNILWYNIPFPVFIIPWFNLNKHQQGSNQPVVMGHIICHDVIRYNWYFFNVFMYFKDGTNLGRTCHGGIMDIK